MWCRNSPPNQVDVSAEHPSRRPAITSRIRRLHQRDIIHRRSHCGGNQQVKNISICQMTPFAHSSRIRRLIGAITCGVMLFDRLPSLNNRRNSDRQVIRHLTASRLCLALLVSDWPSNRTPLIVLVVSSRGYPRMKTEGTRLSVSLSSRQAYRGVVSRCEVGCAVLPECRCSGDAR